MVQYQDGKIYKIVNDVNDEIYVGSTCRTLCKRMDAHRMAASYNPCGKLHTLMNELGYDHFNIVLIEEFPCDNRGELLVREEFYRISLGATLNSFCCYAGLTRKEYNKKHRKDNQEYYTEIHRIYFNAHRDKIITYNKARYYQIKDTEEYKTRVKKYRETHKEELKAWQRARIQCVCGASVSKSQKSQHEKAFYHTLYVFIHS